MYGGRKKQKQLLFKGRNLTSKRFRGHKQGEHIVLMKKVWSVYLRNIKSDLPITTEPVSMKAMEVTTFMLILVPYFKAHNSWAGDLFPKTDLR